MLVKLTPVLTYPQTKKKKNIYVPLWFFNLMAIQILKEGWESKLMVAFFAILSKLQKNIVRSRGIGLWDKGEKAGEFSILMTPPKN